jgi:hypothetical protein
MRRGLIEAGGFHVVEVVGGEVSGSVIYGLNRGSGARNLEDERWIPTSSCGSTVDLVCDPSFTERQVAVTGDTKVHPRLAVARTSQVGNRCGGVGASDAREDER